jgi:small neutral amino acid transporter SnatA (MarC family)
MDPINFIKVLAVTFAALFPVVNPIGDAPIFLSLTRHYSQSAQDILARKIAAYGFALLAVSFLFGSEILAILRVPYLCRLVITTSGEALAIGAEGHGVNDAQVSAQR